MTYKKIAVLGAGSWGTALAVHLARKGYCPVIWSRRKEQIDEIASTGLNTCYLNGIMIPANVKPTCDIEEAVRNSHIVISAVPSHSFREVLSNAYRYIGRDAIIINAAKGITDDTLQRLSEVYRDLTGGHTDGYAVLSGPSHAEEVSLAMPTAVVVASGDSRTALIAQDVLMSGDFRVYTNADITGVELGGSLKNIIALGTGISDGLGFGDNTKAALMTRGLAEITRLGIVAGANPLTFAGLAGLGDLIVTCTSMHSRNRKAGIEIGKGKSPEEAISSVRMVVEGIKTTRAVYKLSSVFNVEMPITHQIHRVLFEGGSPREAVVNLMERGKRNEMEDMGLKL